MKRGWAPLLAVALSLGCFAYALHVWMSHASLLERCYIWEYARLELPGIPAGLWKHTAILNGTRLASPTDSGTFRLVKGEKPVPAWFLHDVIYRGRSLQAVLRWPLIAGGVALALLLMPALWWDAKARELGESGRILRGPRVISNLHWWARMWFKPKGFYLETK